MSILTASVSSHAQTDHVRAAPAMASLVRALTRLSLRDDSALPCAAECGPASRQRRPCTEFRIKIEPRERHLRDVRNGAGRRGEGTFSTPLDEKDLRLLILEMGVPRALVIRGAEAPTGAAARELGGKLFRALFEGDVGVLFLRSRSWPRRTAIGSGSRSR